MGQVTAMRVPTTARPRATMTLPTPPAEMWWKSSVPKTLVKTIGPDEAMHLLDRAPAVNRDVKQTKVDQYARLMMAGLWRPVEQQCDAFAFDVEGRCINGQHRLWAVIESKMTISFEIKIGMPTSAIDTIDDHLKRSDSDVYKITHGGDATPQHLAVATRLMGSKPRGGFDRATKFAALEKHKAKIDEAMELLPGNHKGKVKGLTSASMLTVLTRALHHVQKQRLVRFIEVLQTGRPVDGEGAAILLRDWMLQNGAASTSLQIDLYWKAERALKAFIDRDEIKTLYTASAELFPLPGEKLDKRVDAVAPRRIKERAQRKRR